MNIHLKVPHLRDIKLSQDEVHIRLASLDIPISRFRRLLDVDEQKRAERFHFEKDKNRFIVRRGILRILLSYYLGGEPESVLFSYGEKGKPVIADEFNRERLHFSLSHSRGMAIYAFYLDHEVGVDIEQIRDITEMAQLAERFFSASEKTTWRALPESQKKEAFFNCWTRKEAFIKATGDGLSYPLDGFDVSLIPGMPAKLVAIRGDEKAAAPWSIHDIKPASGFAGAFAIRGQISNIDCRRWVN